MRNLSIVVATIIGTTITAQTKIDHYTASNGITYKIGDRIQLGEGSNNGQFQHLSITGIFKTVNNLTKNSNPDDNVNPSFAGKEVTLKRIKTVGDKTLFIVNKGMVANYELDIEDAIATCEIKDCEESDIRNTRQERYTRTTE